MPYLSTSQEWLTQSALLLQARPTSTRITTKYTLSKPSSSIKSQKRREAAAAKAMDSTAATPGAPPAPPAPKALLTLKTYDPVSGTTLKYQTDKAQEVGRLILSLSRLGREMAALPELSETIGEAMEGVETGEAQGGGVAVTSGTTTPVVPTAQQSTGKNKKRKGKK